MLEAVTVPGFSTAPDRGDASNSNEGTGNNELLSELVSSVATDFTGS